MKRSRYSPEQVAFALRQAESGTLVPEVIGWLPASRRARRIERRRSVSELAHAWLLATANGGT